MTEDLKEIIDIEEEMEKGNFTEDDMIKGLLEAANYTDDEDLWRLIEIKRAGKVLFNFRIRPLTMDEVEACRKAGRKYKNERGRKVIDDYDENATKLKSIYESTVDEDKRLLWDNKKVQSRLDVLTGIDVIRATLRQGEVDAIVDQVNDISGFSVDYSQEVEEIEKAKN